MAKKEKTLYRQILNKCALPNVLCGIVVFLYSILIINIDVKKYWAFCLFFFSLVFIAEFILSPFTHNMFIHKASKMLEESKKREFSVQENTELFLQLHKIPFYNKLSAFLYFLVCCFVLFLSYHFYIGANLKLNLCSFVASLVGSYVASLLEYGYTRSICSKYEIQLAGKGIDKKILEDKKIFGESYLKSFITFVILPIIFSGIIFILTFILYYHFSEISVEGRGFIEGTGVVGISKAQLIRLLIILVINIIVCCFSVYSFLARILTSNTLMQSAMKKIIKNDIFTVELTPTDYDNEVSYNISLVNKVVELTRNVLKEIQQIGNIMKTPIEDLTKISEDTASTSLQQSTAVKEILTTMEETDSQTQGIAKRISEVTQVAGTTSLNVNSGFSTLQENFDKMNEITDANLNTITGIKELGEKIGSIWDIVKLINDIAEQTKIIAFNAELEAFSAGESGKNFHIVANEIRRLAALITNSVNQIKERITEIQHSSDTLIIMSESGTEKIREGLELSANLKDKFTEIQKSSEITAESATKIKEIILQQSASFDQIVSTVRQIASGIENFSGATNTENETALKLKEAATKLENLHQIIVK